MTDHPSAQIHHIEPNSTANGPGCRAVVWFQGCGLACPGCFNPETHPLAGGETWQVDRLVEELSGLAGIEGYTFTGGEPLWQPVALARIANALRRRQPERSLVLLTGYSWVEIQADAPRAAAVAGMDVVIAGRFQIKKRAPAGLAGSTNKAHHFLTGRYTLADFLATPDAEVWISPDGEIRLSGVDPLNWTE